VGSFPVVVVVIVFLGVEMELGEIGRDVDPYWARVSLSGRICMVIGNEGVWGKWARSENRDGAKDIGI